MTKIAIFASGSGSNAENIIKYFANNETVSIKLIISNKEDAYVHQRAKNLGVDSVTYSKNDFYHTDKVLECLLQREVDFIVLAGFLLKIPENLLQAYPD